MNVCVPCWQGMAMHATSKKPWDDSTTFLAEIGQMKTRHVLVSTVKKL
jgi:hypothetical protein